MNVILLPGNHPANNQWIFDLERDLQPYYNLVVTQHYAHWDTETDAIDLEHERQILVEAVANWQDYVIVAKSAGVLVALTAMQQQQLQPTKCVFIGVPVDWSQQKGIKLEPLFQKVDVPVLFVQKSQDPAGAFRNLQQLVDSNQWRYAQYVELPGDNHVYQDTDQLKDLIVNFIQQEIETVE